MTTHHYAFVHNVVPAFAKAQPGEFFMLMLPDSRDQFIELLWRETESHVGPLPTALDIRSTQAICGAINDMPGVFLVMPNPTAFGEAFYLAVISLKGLPVADAPDDADLRYITLELGSKLDGSSRTVLCEWCHGVHYNYGDGPEATFPAFYSALQELLREPPPEW